MEDPSSTAIKLDMIKRRRDNSLTAFFLSKKGYLCTLTISLNNSMAIA